MRSTISAHIEKDDKIELEIWTRKNGEQYYCLSIGELDIYLEDVEKVFEVSDAIEKPLPKISSH